jgi:hypothetical protein
MAFQRTVKQRNFDSVFDPALGSRSARLTIGLKVELFALDPSLADSPTGGQHPVHLVQNLAQAKRGLVKDGDDDPILCRSWLMHEWTAFKTRFKQMVEMSWNNQMILLPADSKAAGKSNGHDYHQLISNPRAPAYVECALDVDVSSSPGGHAEIEVVHLVDARRPFRSWMRRITDTDVEFETSHMKKWPDRKIFQVAAAHEIGHWLRDLNKHHFEHVDRAYAMTLPKDEQDDAEYGHVLGNRVAMMGAGNLCTEHEARPWLGRIRQHFGSISGWTFMHRVHFRQHYP